MSFTPEITVPDFLADPAIRKDITKSTLPNIMVIKMTIALIAFSMPMVTIMMALANPLMRF